MVAPRCLPLGERRPLAYQPEALARDSSLTLRAGMFSLAGRLDEFAALSYLFGVIGHRPLFFRQRRRASASSLIALRISGAIKGIGRVFRPQDHTFAFGFRGHGSLRSSRFSWSDYPIAIFTRVQRPKAAALPRSLFPIQQHPLAKRAGSGFIAAKTAAGLPSMRKQPASLPRRSRPAAAPPFRERQGFRPFAVTHHGKGGLLRHDENPRRRRVASFRTVSIHVSGGLARPQVRGAPPQRIKARTGVG